MTTGILLVVLLGISFLAIYVSKLLARYSFANDREPIPIEKLHAPLKDIVSLECLDETRRVVGKALSINPELIRPEDTLERFWKIDSWSLGKGQDDVETWLHRKSILTAPKIETILDLAQCIERAPKLANHE